MLHEAFLIKNDIFHVIPLKQFRKTLGVDFMSVKMFSKIDVIESVNHRKNAISPCVKGFKEKLWYMHTAQEDNLLLLDGSRHIELCPIHSGKVLNFELSPERLVMDGKVIYEGPAILGWQPFVFHRAESGSSGSKVVNFARHKRGFKQDVNFNIYRMDPSTRSFSLVRKGLEDEIEFHNR